MVQELISQLGYYGVFAGAFLEGETILVLAGFAAHRGLLDLPGVIAVAALGGFLGDQLFFYLGRRHGRAMFARFPRLARSGEKAHRLLVRYDAAAIILVRFLYGLRIAGPVFIGTSGVSAWRFAGFNLLGALVWATAISVAGYVFGHLLEAVIQDIHRYESAVLFLIAAAGLGLWLWRVLRNRNSN